jgi:hypothetical protein
MTAKYLKQTLELVALVTAMAIASVAQTSTTPLSVGSGSVKVLDGQNHVLGTVLGLTPSLPNEFAPNSVVVFKNGYFVALQFDGTFPVGFEYGNQIFWTGANCTGDAYNSSESPMGRRLVVYSRQSNSLYIPAGTAASPPAVTVAALSIESGSGENSTCSNAQSGTTFTETGVLLAPFDAQTSLGWNLCGEPLHVMGPIAFKQD